MISKSLKFYENLSLTNVSFNNNFLRNLKKNTENWYIYKWTIWRKVGKEFSKFIGVNYSINVSNGLDGLILGLKALKLIRKKNI